jgi:hypothetical protein
MFHPKCSIFTADRDTHNTFNVLYKLKTIIHKSIFISRNDLIEKEIWSIFDYKNE